MAEPIPIYLEVGDKRVFACAVEWPGWARSGKTPAAAVAALNQYASRYAAVCAGAKITFPGKPPCEFRTVEEVPGNATTNFGAPGVIPRVDATPLTPTASKKTQGLLQAAWEYFDLVVAKSPATLRKGPRGGGRDRDQMAQHVLNAEAMYMARMIRIKESEPAFDDQSAIEYLRQRVLDAIAAPKSQVAEYKWPPAYAARRIAWHVLDHAWEIEDRSSRPT